METEKTHTGEYVQLTKKQLTLALSITVVFLLAFMYGLFAYNINGMFGILIYPIALLSKEIARKVI